MELVIYAPLDDEAGPRLRKAVEPLSSHAAIESYGDIATMAEKLRRTNGKNRIAVILASSRDELTKILDIGELLENVPSILIIPDMGRETVARGHTLRPRYLGTMDDSFEDVAAVLLKMISNSRRQAN